MAEQSTPRTIGMRLPGPDDPEPTPRRILGMCVWAAMLGLVGLAVGGRALVAVAYGDTPGWYEPTVITVGALGMVLTAAAFTAVQHRRLPWLLLGAATVPLLVNLVASVTAL